MTPRSARSHRRAWRLAATFTAAALGAAGCASAAATDPDESSVAAAPTVTTPATSDVVADDAADGAAADDVATDDVATGDFYDGSVHDVSVELDEADYEAAIADYQTTGEKTWIEVTVTIDGERYEQAGMRLKGNSSLSSLRTDGATCSTDADSNATPSAENLPWLIRLDEFVDGQAHQGRTDFVVRSNSTETALNEIVSLALLGEAGLATEQSASVRFSVNGSDAVLRLVIEHPDDTWTEQQLGDGALFQADAEGDYTYRGSDPADYTEAWDHEAGADDVTALIDFLDFVNNSTDEEFAAGLAERLDVESFARYLAIEELLGNTDDIDGPGNNSYLYFDADGTVTVVAWDHNLALGGSIAGGAGGPGACGFPGGDVPGQGAGQGGPGQGGGPAQGGPRGGDNPLVERFHEVAAFEALYEQAKVDLQAELIDSGFAAQLIDAEAAVLRTEAADVVDSTVVDAEATAVRSALGLP